MESVFIRERGLPFFAKRVLSLIKSSGARFVALSGEMGSGKTTFVRSLLLAMGYNGLDVSSPTFSLVHHYEVDGFGLVCHYDLHRLGSGSELEELMLFDAINNAKLIIVEWPDLAMGYFYGKVVKIKFGYSHLDSKSGDTPLVGRHVVLEVADMGC